MLSVRDTAIATQKVSLNWTVQLLSATGPIEHCAVCVWPSDRHLTQADQRFGDHFDRKSSGIPHQEIYLVLIPVTVSVDPRFTVRQKYLRQWKIPLTSSGIQTATFRLVVQCINCVCYIVIICKMGEEFSCLLSNRNTHYRVYSSPPLTCVLLSMSAGHILTSHTFKIHINTTVPYTQISAKCCPRLTSSD